MIHELKTWPKYFERIVSGEKTFEIRKRDRNFETGDQLKLLEYDPDKEEYTNRMIDVKVTYLLPGGQFGIESDYCVMAIKVISMVYTYVS